MAFRWFGWGRSDNWLLQSGMTTLAGWGWRDDAAPYIRDNYFAATLATRSDYAIHDLLRLLDGRLWRFFGQANFYGSVDSLFYQ